MLLSAIFTLIGIAAVLFLLRFLVALDADGRSARLERFYTYRLPPAGTDRNSTPALTLVRPRSVRAFSEASGLDKRNSHSMGA
jgi:hypothetical protein